MSNLIFKETQQFRQIWIWGTILIAVGVMIWTTLSIQGDGKMEGWESALSLMILATIILLFYAMKLTVCLDDEYLTFRFTPFVPEQKHRLEDIESLELIRYNSLLRFGGWGIRYNFRYWVYNTGGNHGIMVKTKTKKFLLGTQQPTEAAKAIAWFNNRKSARHA